MSREPLDELERQWSADLGLDMAEQADDAGRLSAIVEGAMGRAVPPAVDGGSGATAGTSLGKPLLAGLGIAAVGAVIVAVVAFSEPAPRPGPVESAESASAPVIDQQEEPAVVEAPAPVAPAPAATVEEEQQPEEATEEVADEATDETGPAKPGPAKPGPTRPSLGPDELFAEANAARRAHDYDDAIKLYQRLQREHRGSREAQVSHVALGRLLLDERNKPRKALAQFDAYLSKSKKGSLAEEASVGRALALRELGRADAEREAWQQVLDRFPRTVHASKARARLEALEP